ncbi:MAG TPA: hypothetical protein VMR70_18795 [Flavisolibacter sp.]|nr:hypothetical protein [Flavisolibacter sp.]
MSVVVTKEKEEKMRVFQTVLSSPGMSEKCKIGLQLSRQNILLLGRLVEAGLLSETGGFGDDVFAALPKESVEEWRQIHAEILQKGDLTEFYQRLKML